MKLDKPKAAEQCFLELHPQGFADPSMLIIVRVSLIKSK
ncbi:MAG: hypothetical protein ACI9LY_003187 [Arenicella sp.]|jgi:hypothetical protein